METNQVIKTEQSTIVDLNEETKAILAQAAQDQSKAEVSSIPFISVKGKKFTLGEEKLGTTLSVVILADIFDHAYYDRPYDADAINPPACFAIGKDVSTMVPDKTSPVIQAESCSVCTMNEFGSAPNGKGKACRNGRRLLIAAIMDGKPDLSNLAIINMAPTSLKGYTRYSKAISTVKKLPTWTVVTTLSFDDDSDWPVLVPTFSGILSGEAINEIASRLEEFAEAVSVPYDVSGFEPPEAAVATATKKSKMS